MAAAAAVGMAAQQASVVYHVFGVGGCVINSRQSLASEVLSLRCCGIVVGGGWWEWWVSLPYACT